MYDIVLLIGLLLQLDRIILQTTFLFNVFMFNVIYFFHKKGFNFFLSCNKRFYIYALQCLEVKLYCSCVCFIYNSHMQRVLTVTGVWGLSTSCTLFKPNSSPVNWDRYR